MPDFHRLDPDADAVFLRRAAADPLSRVAFRPANAVVMCATCGLVSLRETWEACGGCPNGHASAAPWNAAEAARTSGDGAARPAQVTPAAFGAAAAPVATAPETAPNRTLVWVALGLAALAAALGIYYWTTRDDTPAPAEAPTAAAGPAAPQSVTAEVGETEGELGATDFRTPDGYYQDLYAFTADSSGRTLTFAAESDAFYPDLVVTTPDGREVEAETVLGDDGASDVRRVSVRSLRGPGTYRVLVSSRRPASEGAYMLRIRQDEPVIALPTNGRQVSGAFTTSSARADGRYRDTYSFAGEAQREHTVTVRSGAFTPTVTVTGPAGAVRGTSAPAGGATVFRFTPDRAGTYRVVVSTAETARTGTYPILLALGAAPPAAAATRPAAADDASTAGTLRAGGAAVRDSLASGDTRSYGASGRVGDRVSVEVRASGFTPTLTIIAPDGQRTAGAPDGDRARARVTLPADGRFRVVVGSAGGSGTFSVSLEQTAGVTAAPIPRLPGADTPPAEDPADAKPPVPDADYRPQPLGNPN